MKFGEFEIFSISDGLFRLDGGAMFGVVPKALWQRTNEPDTSNRILLGLNCLLIKSKNDNILVDTGVGQNFDEKFAGMFGIDHEKGELHQGLAEHGLSPEDITKVVMTHLHFDHSGGNCKLDESGQEAPAFPNAVYHIRQGEFEYANDPDPRSKGSYLKKNWQALEKSGQIELNKDDAEIIPGVSVELADGHTRDHQVVKICSENKTACFLADLVPTQSHLKTPYVMGYDLYPKTTMEVKARILQQAFKENWLLLFEHSPNIKAGYLMEKEGRFQLNKISL